MERKKFDLKLATSFFVLPAIILFSFILNTPATEEIRSRTLFCSDWKFYRSEVGNFEKADFDDSKWRILDLPHDWSIEGSVNVIKSNEIQEIIDAVTGEWLFHKGDSQQYRREDFDDTLWQRVKLPAFWESSYRYRYGSGREYGWYRRTITIPESLKGKKIILHLGMIDDADATYLNGIKIGGSGSFPPNYKTAWNLPRYYEVPDNFIKFGKENILAVRVYNDRGRGGIYGTQVIEGPFDSATSGSEGYLSGGTGWYRKTFQLPESIKEKRVFIKFDGIYMNSDVWLNEHFLGNYPYGYTSFQYELTPFLNYGSKKNVLVVRVKTEQPCSRWYSGSGIYRNVWLTVTEPVHVAHWGTYITTPKVTEQEATINVETNVLNQGENTNNVSLETIIVDKNGQEVARDKKTEEVVSDTEIKFTQTLKITNPQLWSTKSPYLYEVISKVSSNGKLVDNYTSVLGIRTFQFTENKGFFLNGKHVNIKGVCLHHDLGCIGSAVYYRGIERQLEIMKEMGCNAIRTSHNPPAPELLVLCDKMGFLVMDEIFDEWKRSKTDFGYGRFFDEWGIKDLQSMLYRDRNHPSIIMWSIGNEIPEQYSKEGALTAKTLADVCHQEDPTRPVTSGCNGIDKNIESGFADALDIVGVNYNTWAYSNYKDTGRKLIASETSSTVSTRGEYNLENQYGKIGIDPLENNQCTSYDLYTVRWGTPAEESLNTIKNSPWIAGEFVWTGFDYIGEPTPFGWPSRSSYFGIVDLAGFPKDRFYLYQSQWSGKPMVHILPHWNWEGYEGMEIPVWAYSNCDSVELFLNGESLGKKTWEDTDQLHLEWAVPYKPGTLKAVGKKDGKIACTEEVATAGKPHVVVLSADRTEIESGGYDLSYITVKIVDEKGNICPNAENEVIFDIKGAGSILGVDNGNPISHEDFKTNRRKAFHGLCLVVVKSAKTGGAIELTATSEGLNSDSVTILTK